MRREAKARLILLARKMSSCNTLKKSSFPGDREAAKKQQKPSRITYHDSQGATPHSKYLLPTEVFGIRIRTTVQTELHYINSVLVN